MIPNSLLARSAAFALSATTVLGVVYGTSSNPVTLVEAAGVPVQTKLGNSFQDMAVGTLPASPSDKVDPAPLERTDAPQPTSDDAPETPSLSVTAPSTVRTPAKAASVTAPAAAQQPELVVPIQTRTAVQSKPTVSASESAQMTAALTTSPSVVQTVTRAAQPAPASRPSNTEASRAATALVAPAPKPDTAKVIEPDTSAPLLSQRPKLRDPSKAPPPKAAPKRREQVAKKAPPKPRGNATQQRTAGSVTSQSQTAKAVQQGNAGRKPQQGNAKVSNYAGRINRCVRNRPQPSLKGHGKATVEFKVAANGALKQIRVVKSSGNAAVDRTAIATVRSASPCPPPPKDARRSFKMKIGGNR